MPVSAGRSLALRALGDTRRTGRWIRDALRAEAENSDTTPQDRALAWRLAMGATAAKGLLEERIREHARRPSSIQPRVMDALRLSAFELLYLETPIPVAVNEGVELVRSIAPKAASFANAVLRKLAPLRAEVAAARERIDSSHDTEGDLLLVSALPPWLLHALNRSLTYGALKLFCTSVLNPAPRWLAQVGEGPVPAELAPMLVPGAYLSTSTESAGERHAPFVHSDLAAQTVAQLTVPPDGASRLEVGMGRGTKTLIVAHALAAEGRRAELVGVESDGRRLREARERIDALGYAVATYRLDARRVDGDPRLADRRFDLVLLDAPCTGTGTLRRHPEIAWSLRPEALDLDEPGSLASLQTELLAAVSRSVAPGGLLAYSTCSVLKEENDGRIAAFLSSAAGRRFAPVDIRETPSFRRLPERARAFIAERIVDGAYRTTPSDGDADGHFLRCLRLEMPTDPA